GVDIGGWNVQSSGTEYYGCMVRNSDGATRCASAGGGTNYWIFNNGCTGSCTDIAPANQNLIRNPSFSSGMTYWQFYGGGDYAISNGVFGFRWLQGTASAPRLQQEVGYSIMAGAPFQYQLDLGNSSANPKIMRIHLRGVPTNWNE